VKCCVLYVSVVSEDDELSAIEEPSHSDVNLSEETDHRLYGRQQISFTVCLHIVLLQLQACIVSDIWPTSRPEITAVC